MDGLYKKLDTLKKLDLMVVSLDGTRDVHDMIRKKPGSYDKVIESIKTAKKNKIPVVVNTCVMSSNIHDIKELSLVIKELDVNWTVDAYYEPTIVKDWQQGSNLTRPTEDLLTKIVEIGKSNKNLVNSEEYLKTFEKKKKHDICFAGIGYAVVSPDGKLYPCFPAQHDEEFEGMDLKKMSFKDAFDKMPLYRKNCDTCNVICHMEANSLFRFKLNSIKNAFKYLKSKS